MTRHLFFALAALFVATGCAADPSGDESTETEAAESGLSRYVLGANGDSCTVRTNPDGTKVPGTEKDGECCSNSDSTDCVIILKNPFPKSAYVYAK